MSYLGKDDKGKMQERNCPGRQCGGQGSEGLIHWGQEVRVWEGQGCGKSPPGSVSVTDGAGQW